MAKAHLISEESIKLIIAVFERLEWAVENDNTNGQELTKAESELYRKLKELVKE